MTHGLDPASAALAEPPRPPAARAALTPAVLAATAKRIALRATTMGLSRWSWGEGVLLYSLLRLAGALGESGPPPFVRGYLDRHLAAGLDPGHVNDLAPGAACAELWAGTGQARYRHGAEELLTFLDGARRAPNGAIEHWPGGVWADTAYMAGTFLVRYGLALRRPDLVAEAGRQLRAHAELLQHPDTGLYAHGAHRGETIWCFWGRANAWTALAAVELLSVARTLSDPDLDRIVVTVTSSLERQLRALAGGQPDHGVWDVLVDGQVENRGILETSAAAGIGAAMLRAAALGVAPEVTQPAGWRALCGVHAYVADDGTLTRTSAGTVLQLVPFGYSVIRSDRIQPWGQGLALQLYAAALTEPHSPPCAASPQ
jgi:unsaturated rhamnogalacturonyl hydrolase